MDRLRHHLKPGCCRRAAQLIVNHPGVVLLGTGFAVAGTFESDGPIGAIALYRILREIGSRPVFVCAPPISRVMSRSFQTFELPIAGWDESRPVVKKALKELRPTSVVAVERAGKAADGRYYDLRGVDISDSTAKYERISDPGRHCHPRAAQAAGCGRKNPLNGLHRTARTPHPERLAWLPQTSQIPR